MSFHAAATCVVATTYEAKCVDEAKNEICLLICCCGKFPYKSQRYNLKQLCVDRLMAAKNTSQRGILSEVPFDMTQTPPKVITDTPDTRYMTAVPRWNKIFTDEERDVWRDIWGNNPSKKPIRIPDVVVLKNPDGPINQANIEKIYEIKFPPDRWKPGQEEAYQEIAGDSPGKVEKNWHRGM